MSEKHEYQMARREATLNEIKKAKQRLDTPSATMLARVALAVVYMYLILMSYELLGISGPVFISIIFLAAFFIPWTYATVGRRLSQRRTPEGQAKVHAERQQEA